LARLMVQIHQRGVITRDPSPENFIKTVDGKILFIDFGRSVILNPKNPAIIDYLGKELARIHCHAFAGDDQLYNRFHEWYFELYPHNTIRRYLMERIGSKWYQRFVRKHM
jgi:serine/threonine protein kinase